MNLGKNRGYLHKAKKITSIFCLGLTPGHKQERSSLLVARKNTPPLTLTAFSFEDKNTGQKTEVADVVNNQDGCRFLLHKFAKKLFSPTFRPHFGLWGTHTLVPHNKCTSFAKNFRQVCPLDAKTPQAQNTRTFPSMRSFSIYWQNGDDLWKEITHYVETKS